MASLALKMVQQRGDLRCVQGEGISPMGSWQEKAPNAASIKKKQGFSQFRLSPRWGESLRSALFGVVGVVARSDAVRLKADDLPLAVAMVIDARIAVVSLHRAIGAGAQQVGL